MGNPATEATIDIGVRPSNDMGAKIYSLPANKPGGLENGYRILSVDGKNITGKSADEIKELLKGPRGSQVKLQVLTKKGEVLTVSVTRELADTHPRAGTEERNTASSAEKLDLYDSDFLPTAYAESAHAGLSTVIEPFITAQANIAAKKAESWFGNSIATVAVYADLVPLYDRVGRFDKADELASKIMTLLRSLPAESLRTWQSYDYSNYLPKSGRREQLSALNDLLGKKFENRLQVETNYALASNALKAIEQKDAGTANDLINGLVSNLEEASETGKYYNKQPIWYYLNAIERAYVNRGQVAEAAKLRARLIVVAKKCSLSDSALIPLLVDSCLTAAPNGDANAWAQLEKSQVFATTGTEPLTITPAEKLRRFALAYTYSADYKRARMLLNKAQALANGSNARAHNIASALPSLSAHNEFADDETLTLVILDTAIVDLLTGKYAEAKNAVDALQSKNLTVGQTAARKLSQIAFLYAQASHSDEGEKLLANLIAKSKDKAATDRTSRIVVPGFYQWKLGELLINRKQDQAALPHIDAAMAQYKSIGAYSGLLDRAAKLYERLGKYEQAASTYYDTQASFDSRSDYRAVDFRGIRKNLLESALACANKAPKLPPEIKANIVRRLSGYVGSADPARQAVLEKQEMSLLKAGSPESVRLAVATTRRLKSSKAPPSELIDSLEKAVDLAKKGNDRQTVDLLIQLAEAEVSNNQLTKGIAHAQEAIKLGSLTQSSTAAVSLIARSGNSLAESLYKTGHKDETEKLLSAAAAVDNTAGSTKPNIAISSKASLVVFYFNVGEIKKADAIVDGLFAKYAAAAKESDSRFWNNAKISAATLNRISILIGTRGANQRAGFDIANRLLQEQRKLLVPNDLQIAETLGSLAQIYERTDQLVAAEDTYREIMALYAKYPNERSDMSVRMRYSMLLHRLGKREEADKLRDLRH
ncbi:MAG: hypothetical protein WCT03_04915 [Candidatus Obscuribacterales bacterium]|jgi:hypothetical protein